jgi:hypothetical protein
MATAHRCCSKISDEFKASYASVLVAPDLEKAVTEVESGQLCPCITAWCSSCQAPYLLTTSLDLFPTASAHHAHMLVLHHKFRVNKED